jgi:hypothetical protein
LHAASSRGKTKANKSVRITKAYHFDGVQAVCGALNGLKVT